MHDPLVSIIVPSYNQGRFIRETLESILAQDYRPLEVLVIDGGSTDGTLAVLQEFEGHSELRWWSEPDEGVADAVNKGLALAQGTYAGIQSSDDVYRPGAVADAVRVLRSAPGVGLVYADAEIIDQTGACVVLAPNRLPFTPARFLARSTVIHQSSAFFVLDLARQIGGWRSEYFCADTEMWLRMIFRTQVRRADRVWSGWRKHDDQRDVEARRMWDAWGRMVSESEELRGAPLRLRLAAKAGRRMMAVDYNPTASQWFQWAQIWLAIFTYPPSRAAVHSSSLLSPPGLSLRRRAKRLLTRQARTP